MLSTQKCVCLLQQSIKISNGITLIRQQSSQFFTLSTLSYSPPKHRVPNQQFVDRMTSATQHSPLLSQCMQLSSNSTDKLSIKEGQHVVHDKTGIKPENIEIKPITAEPTTYKEKLKQAMAQYGSTVIIFHITISLMSLGTCYMLVASGLDLSSVFEKLGLSESSVNKLASSSGTFAAAYLIHKVFAPVRLSITLTCTPFIVRYLRKAGIIKKALPKVEPKK